MPSVFLISVVLASTIWAGIRGPGEYTGIVIYDRWDTCYLYSGTYLMYIAEKRKNLLRQYEGQSILVDAKEVSQPINPGDGLITKFKFLGLAKPKRNLPEVEGLRLSIHPDFDLRNGVQFRLQIENRGDKIIGVDTSEISPTLFGEKDTYNPFSPSDGKSDAKITRCSFESIDEWKHDEIVNRKNSTGNLESETISFSIGAEDRKAISPIVELAPGEKKEFVVTLCVPRGEFQFLFGYGGGVHEGKGLASNLIAFSVNSKGMANLFSGSAVAKGASYYSRLKFSSSLSAAVPFIFNML
jgi:hypothetical protein